MIDQLELHHLRTLNMLFECGTLPATVERLGLSQQAVSQQLKKMRQIIDDPLFAERYVCVTANPALRRAEPLTLRELVRHEFIVTLYDGAPHGLSHAVVDTVTGLVFVSGQVDWTPEYQVESPDIAVQTRNALGNLRTVLSEAGSSIERVLQLRIYVRGEVAGHLPQLMPCLLEFLGASRPAVTGVGVSSLASPATLVEIEAIARVEQAAPRVN